MSELVSLIRGEAPIARIAAYLDGLADEARELEVNELRRKDQARLFEKAADGPPSRLTDFVPAHVPDRTAVHHPGRNTVATFTYFQRFQKRFSRPTRESAELYGYNASNAWFIHPGYFVAYETAACSDEWRARGAVVVDYHRVPPAAAFPDAVPDGWPRIVPNSQGLQRLVYYLTRDFMRRVSKGVSIGRASREDAKGDRILDYWFTLCRRDLAEHRALGPGA
jgi:hypothetical protein